MDEIFALYETLAKQVVYVDDNPTFAPLVQGFLQQGGYRLDRTFDNPQTGLHGIGLISTTGATPPVLVFRGADGLSDDPTLIDPQGVGLLQLNADREAIAQWLRDAQERSGRLPDILGHSLGGAVAQQTAAAFPTQFNRLVTFNSPGIGQITVNRFLSSLGLPPEGIDPRITHFIVDGDLVSLVGQAFLPGVAFLQSFFDPTLNPAVVLPGSVFDTVPDKHTVQGLLSTPPADLVTQSLAVSTLSRPTFTFTGPDFQEFIAAIPQAVPFLSTLALDRQNLETLRTFPGSSFFGVVDILTSGLAFSQPNFLVGTDLPDTVFSLEGNDTVVGNGGDDFFNGNQGNDTLAGNDGNDTLWGGKGDDTLTGGNGNDLLNGNIGNDRVEAGDGNDTLFGGQNNDFLLGGEGDDRLSGDLGNDTLQGGAGRDQFLLAPGRGTDRIEDFQGGIDRILLEGLTFNQLTITQDTAFTSIRVTTTGEIIATLGGVSASSLTSADFTAP